MIMLKNLFALCTLTVAARAAVPLGYHLRQNATNSTNTTDGNYYNGVRCDWWCPEPAKGAAPIDPPTEAAGCICEIPDSRPLTDQEFDLIDAWLGGFKANEGFVHAMPCSTALRGAINNMNSTTMQWKDLEATTTTVNVAENTTTVTANYTDIEKFKYYLFNTTEWISFDLAPSSGNCFGVGIDIWQYVTVKESQFNEWSDVGLAFLQNMLGNSISF